MIKFTIKRIFLSALIVCFTTATAVLANSNPVQNETQATAKSDTHYVSEIFELEPYQFAPDVVELWRTLKKEFSEEKLSKGYVDTSLINFRKSLVSKICKLCDVDSKFLDKYHWDYDKNADASDKTLKQRRQIIEILCDRYYNRMIDLFYRDTNTQVEKRQHRVSEIFKKRPYQYGWRGDPGLWDALQEDFEKENLSVSKDLTPDKLEELMISKICDLCHVDREYFLNNDGLYVEEFVSSGGMTCGTVCFKWWQYEVKVLADRYYALMCAN